MTSVRFIPEPGTPAQQEQFGIMWGPEPIKVTDPRILAKVRNNPFYEIVGDKPAEQGENKAGYRAKHEAGGRYIVVFGDEDEKILKGLSKADAEAFNALSDDEKAAKVAAVRAAV